MSGAGALALTRGGGTALAPGFPLVVVFAFTPGTLAASAAFFARVRAALAAAALAASILARCAVTRSVSRRSDSFREYSAARSPSDSRNLSSRLSSMALAELCSLKPIPWS